MTAGLVRLAGAGRGVGVASGSRPWQGFGVPLFVIALLMAVFALSPRVTAAGSVLVDLSGPWAERFAVFRATGRFFWPLGYLLMASALATIATRLPSRVALTVLLTLLIVQALDLHGAHEERRRGARDPELLCVGQSDGVAGVGAGVACIQSPRDLSASSVRPGADRLGTGGVSSRPARPDAERRRRRAPRRCGAAALLSRSGRAGEGRPPRSAELLHRAAHRRSTRSGRRRNRPRSAASSTRCPSVCPRSRINAGAIWRRYSDPRASLPLHRRTGLSRASGDRGCVAADPSRHRLHRRGLRDHRGGRWLAGCDVGGGVGARGGDPGAGRDSALAQFRQGGGDCRRPRRRGR